MGSDDYKVDPRQPVEDFQVAFEIEELRRSVDKIAEELQQLETTNFRVSMRSIFKTEYFRP